MIDNNQNKFHTIIVIAKFHYYLDTFMLFDFALNLRKTFIFSRVHLFDKIDKVVVSTKYL